MYKTLINVEAASLGALKRKKRDAYEEPKLSGSTHNGEYLIRLDT